MAKKMHDESGAETAATNGKHDTNGAKPASVPPLSVAARRGKARVERKGLKKLAKLEKRERHAAARARGRNGVPLAEEDRPVRKAERQARRAEKKRLKRLRRSQEKAEGAGEGGDMDTPMADPIQDAAVEIPDSTSETPNAAVETPNNAADETPDAVTEIPDAASEKPPAPAKKKEKKEKKKTKKSATKDSTESSNLPSSDKASTKPQPASLSNYIENASLAALPPPEIESFLTANEISIEDNHSNALLRPIIQFSHLPSDAATTLQKSFPQFQTPTPIQSASWPFGLSGRDLIGVAETGSGKTLAFGIPCLRHIQAQQQSITPPRGPLVAVVSPTRELAVQIHEQLSLLATPAGISSVCVYGGVPKDPQRTALKKAHIVVATPGRLNDLVSEGAADLSSVTYLVLDEADRMLDKGFEDAIREIVSGTASNDPSSQHPRQTLMFTATWPASVRDLAATFMRHPARITIGSGAAAGELRANARITQRVEVVDPLAKEQRLVQLLRENQGPAKDARILVFCLYKKEAARIESFLARRGTRVAGIHGDMNQERRSASLASFRDGSAPVLVATDVAARGLDIPDVKAVINVTFPLTVEDYVHRIGRTGRAGADGLAITLFTLHDKAHAGALVNVLRAAGQEVPEDLLKFGTAVKRKGHEAYGNFYREPEPGKKAVKIKFDD